MGPLLRTVGLLALTCALLGCSGGEGTTDVKAIQEEAKSDVPKDLGKVPPELAEKGLKGGDRK